MSILDSLKQILPLSGAAIGLAGVTWGLAKYLNETLNEDIRLQVSLWFYGDAPRSEVHTHISKLFTSLFGDRLFSWKFVRRVVVFSLAMASLWWVTWSLIFASDHGWRDQWDWKSWREILLNSFVFNLPLDYLALLKTGLILRFASKHWRSVRLIFLAVLIDFVLTSLVLYASRPLVEFEYVLGRGLGWYADGSVVPWFSLGILILHSVWLLIYFLAALVARSATWMGQELPIIGKFLNRARIEKDPITLIGEFAAGLMLLAFLVVGIAIPPKAEAPASAETAAAIEPAAN